MLCTEPYLGKTSKRETWNFIAIHIPRERLSAFNQPSDLFDMVFVAQLHIYALTRVTIGATTFKK